MPQSPLLVKAAAGRQICDITPESAGWTLAPLLWRLVLYGIDLPSSGAPLLKYAETVFARNSFIDSMTPSEKVMRR